VRLAGHSWLLVRLAPVGALALVGCGEPSPPVAFASPRADDPPLVHSWQLPAGQSVLHGGDLGSEPPALADALMADSAAPSIAHRSARACARQGALASTASVALRLTIAEGGALAALEADPPGPAADCLAAAVRAELATLDPLPAGAALMVLRFDAAAPK
jgi:hypothetical protein